ncbi:MAG: hypothetical protein CSA68_07670 [Rhodobacterales bacterium]|nr:MAG: hypothetical protein CSA68_07670 [Rhodobacterales bacterium]
MAVVARQRPIGSITSRRTAPILSVLPSHSFSCHGSSPSNHKLPRQRSGESSCPSFSPTSALLAGLFKLIEAKSVSVMPRLCARTIRAGAFSRGCSSGCNQLMKSSLWLSGFKEMSGRLGWLKRRVWVPSSSWQVIAISAG